jgi:hypothetical protein
MAEERALYWEVLYWRDRLARVSAEIERKAGTETDSNRARQLCGLTFFWGVRSRQLLRGDGAVLLLSKEEHEVLDEGHR